MQELKSRVADRSELEERVGEVQRAVAEVETSVLDRVDSEVKRSIGAHPGLRAASDAVARMRRDERPAEHIIATYSGSVCLIQGAYGFGKEIEGEWKFLREASPELLGSMDVSGDKVPLMLDGDGPVFSVDYTGTGFLVDRRGIVITNRHIAEPWWRNEAAQPLLADGYQPRFVHLRAFFPGRKKPVVFRLGRTLVSEDADLAALFFPAYKGLPKPLVLANPREVAAGRRVLLLGYPSGLDALIARAGDDFKQRLEDSGGIAPSAVLDDLAAQRLVRPLPTLGHIGDVLSDKIVYDAATAVGGSGGPLVDMEGRVVAVNYGILKAFRGANFGVPVSFAIRLLNQARAK
jgi:S1-C subfamily serine protease